MEVLMREKINPLKRSFEAMVSEESPRSLTPLNFRPRGYQSKVFQVAKKRNTIAVLETGAGKTMISVMLIKEFAPSLNLSPQKRLIVFLAPTVQLVHQQFEVIKSHTNLRVDKYYGAKGVDEWSAEHWEKEITENDVLVMTPQILLDALRKAFLDFKLVTLLILDECHRATGNHPYSKIMMEFYHKSNAKPKIFGMTASPVTRKGVSSMTDCEMQISTLESTLDSQIYTVVNRIELEAAIPSAIESCRYYYPGVAFNLDVKAKLESPKKKFEVVLLEMQTSVPDQYKDTINKCTALNKRLSDDYSRVLHCLEDLGLLCALEAIQVCLANGSNAAEECEFYAKGSSQCKMFLQEVLAIVSTPLQDGVEYILDTLSNCSTAVSMGYISPKLYELLEVFESFGDASQMQCLIFVDRIVTAEVLVRIMKKMKFLSHLSFAYVTGSSTSVGALSSSVQKATLDLFRSGKVNLLFATDVVEEGTDIPTCSSVIRFDLPKTVRSYIQSRGRARQKDSQFVLMLERGNTKQREQIYNIIRSEYSMTNTAINRDPDSYFIKPCTMKERDTYTVEGTGASVTLDSSVTLIHQYCQKLPGDKHFVPKPNFQFLTFDNSYKCQMTLPPNAAFQTLVGPLGLTANLSKQLVCFEACKKLHEMGAFNDHLLPIVETPSKKDSLSKGSALGAGTTKRKELHGTTPVRALAGTWHENKDSRVFHAYTMCFLCSNHEEHFSSFVLLLDTKLDEDVGNVEFDLYLVSKFVKSSVAYYGEIRLDTEQVATAMSFQELLFNGLFGKLFVRSKSSKERKFLLQESLWDPSYAYLLLPLVSFGTIQESLEINWRGIDSCASAVEFMKKNARLCNTRSSDENGILPNNENDIIKKENVLYFANNTIDSESVEEMVVLAIHTGKMYSIVKVVEDTNAESPFDGNSEGNEAPYLSFFDYFSKKYGIVLMHPRQPMLRLKQSHNAHNLLIEFRSEEGVSSEKDLEEIYKKVEKKAQFHVHVPPELLVVIDIPISIIKSIYLLPSMMHRLESLMLASQLREEISCPPDTDFRISSSLILEAITTMRCNEVFSLERLELLGDSVLKYAVSCHLYLKYPKKHEGQLSAQRSWAVCNSTLHKRGTDRKLQGYIRDNPFDARRWSAPGQRTMRPYPCSCGVDTQEVPLDSKFQTSDPKITLDKCCDMGHRWMSSKTISDCVEGLIGAYYVGSGLVAALHLMTWLGIEAELEPSLLDEAIKTASLHSYLLKEREIQAIEAKIGYIFTTKGLLLEAITHASDQETAVPYCYQRLEFLGDSVLDILITRHLYESHAKIDPGELTDLRSASVNNESFAHAAIRKDLHPHLQHCSGLLLIQISNFVKSVSSSNSTTNPFPNGKVPKALGDLVESIAGAILVDTKLDLEEVWRIYEPLLSPIVTPDKLELPPLRELMELCDSLGYFVKESCISKGQVVHAELRLQLRDVLLVGEGVGPNKKTARGRAASKLLKDLESRGVSNSKKSKKLSDTMGIDANNVSHANGKLKADINNSNTGLNAIPSANTHFASSTDIPVLPSVSMKKGGPRSFLYELCKKEQWPMPTFDTAEQKSRTLTEFSDGSTGFNSYTSIISLTIPEYGTIKLTGESRADKKRSYDSAAIVMLHELHGNGKLGA